MRAVSVFLVATGLGLFGCAEVKPPSAVSPSHHHAADGTAGDADVDATAEGDGVVPAAFGDDASAEEDHDHDGEEGDESEDFEGDDGEDSVDIMACLDRGPGTPPHCPQFTWKSPLEGLTSSEIEHKVKNDLASIGPISVGPANGGRLFNGVKMPENDKWRFTDPGNAFGTQETVDSIARAIEKVFHKFPDSPKVYIGHLSSKGGGHLRPHKSHQSGRDVDLSYFYTKEVGWYAKATDKNLDRARTWAFVKAFLEDPNTEMILVDTSVQRLLYDYALEQKEDPALLDKIFQFRGKNNRPLIRHVAGHQTHIHVRFFSPAAQASGRLAAAYLPKPPPPPKRSKGKHVAKGDEPSETNAKKKGDVAKKQPQEDDDYILHRARNGDTLDSLSRRYGVSVQAIKQANGLKSNELKQKRTYRIPKSEKVASAAPSKGGKKK